MMQMAIIGAGKWGLAVYWTRQKRSSCHCADAVSSSAEGSRDLSLGACRGRNDIEMRSV